VNRIWGQKETCPDKLTDGKMTQKLVGAKRCFRKA